MHYTGTILIFLWVLFTIYWVLVIVVLEKLMLEHFPDTYPGYKKKAGFLFPKIR